MKSWIIESWFWLVYFDYLMQFRGFESVHAALWRQEVQACRDKQPSAIPLSHAMDLACVFYVKRVLCLQRSAATAVLLRRHGWAAEMVIGAQLLPFESHAWVEIDGLAVNDKPYITEMLEVLERC